MSDEVDQVPVGSQWQVVVVGTFCRTCTFTVTGKVGHRRIYEYDYSCGGSHSPPRDGRDVECFLRECKRIDAPIEQELDTQEMTERIKASLTQSYSPPRSTTKFLLPQHDRYLKPK